MYTSWLILFYIQKDICDESTRRDFNQTSNIYKTRHTSTKLICPETLVSQTFVLETLLKTVFNYRLLLGANIYVLQICVLQSLDLFLQPLERDIAAFRKMQPLERKTYYARMQTHISSMRLYKMSGSSILLCFLPWRTL